MFQPEMKQVLPPPHRPPPPAERSQKQVSSHQGRVEQDEQAIRQFLVSRFVAQRALMETVTRLRR